MRFVSLSATPSANASDQDTLLSRKMLPDDATRSGMPSISSLLLCYAIWLVAIIVDGRPSLADNRYD